jgi:DNA-binding NarL/FixJ family response regulator
VTPLVQAVPGDWVRLVTTCKCLPCIGLVQAFAVAQAGPADDEERERMRDVQLSQAELRTLQAIAEGCSNKEIGVRLHCAESTIKNRLIPLFRKLRVYDRTQAAIVALEAGLVRCR